MYRFSTIPQKEVDWQQIESSYDSTVFHSKKWCDYLSKIGNKVICFSVQEDDDVIGYFVGVKKWVGVTMICAPQQGTGTYTQGLCFKSPVTEEKRVEVYKALAEWLFKNHIASYLQVDDWHLRGVFPDWVPTESWKNKALVDNGIDYSVRVTLFLDSNKSEEELWAGLHYKSAKYSINKATKLGLRVRFIDKFEDISEFSRVHSEHIKNVHKRHGTRPKMTESRKRIQTLCESLFPDRVLMAQAIGNDEDGKEQIMASAVFGYDKGECTYFTSGSYSQYLKKYCPNEIMLWEALKVMRNRGAEELNFGGMNSYKLKYVCVYAYVPRLYFYKFKIVKNAKVLALKYYHKLRHLLKSE